MARYSSQTASGYAWERVTVPVANVPHGVQKGTPEQRAQWEKDGSPKPQICGIRCLSPDEDMEVDARAAELALEKGVKEYTDTNPICVNARMICTLAMACVDPDSDPHKPVLFFGDTVDEAIDVLRKDPKRSITPDTIAYLHERYEMWRDKINPQANTIADHQLQEIARKSADDADFLAKLRPGLRLKFTASLAALALPFLDQIFGGLSTSSEPSKKQSPKPQNKTVRKSNSKARRK
jgi:hypothetical protein